MLDKMLVTVFSAILVTVICMHLLLCCLPLLRRIEFDAICHTYAMLMDQSGGLPGTAADELVQKLQERHFSIVHVVAPQQAAYGETMIFSVRAACRFWQMTPDMAMEEYERWFCYETGMVCRVLKNFGAVH
ncbi:MAG: hypothetical protein GX173_12120 [Ruminococcaceae bacterium]|jgi:hypothetical protein|nr:hypothetical protein [Oscillospiraceae bacterium]